MGAEIEQIKERLNIAEVVGEYVQLKPAGRNMKGLCPFHSEKTPSFIISPDRGTWHCFGCSEGGDHFSFIQKVEGVDFPAALRMLAERAGVQLTRGPDTETTSRRQRLFDLLAESTRFYHEILMKHGAAEQARDYLQTRGLKPETWKLLNIGYAPQSWDGLQSWLKGKRFSQEEMVAAGVVGRSERGKYFDRFRGRIMFPISDTQGRTVAFGGRIAPWHETGNEGKYVNSPETSLYEKRAVVYNLHRARQVLRSGQACLVVEGYMDVAMLEQVGVRNVVASSGTAFTVEQIGQIKRFTEVLHFAFDADAAGWKATVAATEAALREGMRVATVTLPEGKDPADLALEQPERVAEVLADTRPLMEVLLEQLADKEVTSQQLETVGGLLALVTNPIQQGQMVQEVAAILHVPESVVLKIVANRPVTGEFGSDKELEHRVKEGGIPPRSLVEQQVLGALLSYPDLREVLWGWLEGDIFLDPQTRMLYNSLQELIEEGTRFFDMSARDLIDQLAAAQQPYAEGLMARAEDFLETAAGGREASLRELVRWLKREHLKRQLQLVQGQLSSQVEGDRAEALQQFQALAEELSAL